MFLEKKNSFFRQNGRKIQVRKIEGVVFDSYYFTEFGVETGHTLRQTFEKHDKWKKLSKDLEHNSISLRGKWMAAVASSLGHVLDKVYNIFFSKRKKETYYTITTEDGFSIEASANLEILTMQGYKPVRLITKDDKVMTMVNSTFNFKTNNQSNFVDINKILSKYENTVMENDGLYLSDLTEEERKIIYILWFKFDNIEKKISVQEFLQTRKFFGDKQKKTKNDISIEDRSPFLYDFIVQSELNYQYKSIKKIEKAEKEDVIVFNINTAIAENIIFNNFIIRQNC